MDAQPEGGAVDHDSDVMRAGGGDESGALARDGCQAEVEAACADGDAARLAAALSKLPGEGAHEKRAALIAMRNEVGYTPLHLCTYRQKGAGAGGWMGCVAQLLQLVFPRGYRPHGDDPYSVDGATWINAVNEYFNTALWGLVMRAGADWAGSYSLLVAVFLAHGAVVNPPDANRVYPVGFSLAAGDQVMQALLYRGSQAGSAVAVREGFAWRADELMSTTAWDIFRDLPSMQRAQWIRGVRVLIALWGDSNARHGSPRGSSGLLKVVVGLPRNALREVIAQLAL